MRILIVEDELPTAEDIGILVKKILRNKVGLIRIETTLDNALSYLHEHPVDVLLLDLKLHARDGFDILRRLVSRPFHTIVISANIDRAIEAFEYGVLDFIPKPYNAIRLKAAFDRLESTHSPEGRSLKYLSVKNGYEIRIIPLDDVRFFKSSNIYVELHLKNGSVTIYDKSIKNLNPLLPSRYFRIHKSYIVDTGTIDRILTRGGGKYQAVLKSGDCLPVSRQKATALKKILDL